MPDNKLKKGKQDRSKVALYDPDEVRWIHRKYPELTHTEIITAIKKAGPSRKNIELYINRL